MKLAIEGGQWMLDGRPHRIVSGSIHYFRVVPEYWEDRLEKLIACGFNTVETYIPWNVHEPKEGRFQFSGDADVESYVRLAQRLGLTVILRPSPYICSEWDGGGLPFWLLADGNMRLRCFHQPYLDKISRYYDELIPRLLPLLSTNGGPVVAMQIENEYGSYGNDKQYLKYLYDEFVRRGVDVPLFTSDGPEDGMLQGGTLPEATATVNFGSRPEEAFAKLREYRPDDPLMCMEFWCGWFDHWGEKHHTRDERDVADTLDGILRAGASVNFYMFHGGTNFGFRNGANNRPPYASTITSYDSHALLDEAGDPTPKYEAVREVLARYVQPLRPSAAQARVRVRAQVRASRKANYGAVALAETAALFDHLDALSSPLQATCPEPMEKVGQDYGFILYSTRVTGPRASCKLFVQDVRDRALVFLDGRCAGVLERGGAEGDGYIDVNIPAEGATLDILVENMGRTNYGPYMRDPKGITEGVRLNNQFLFHWTIRPLPLTEVSHLPFRPFDSAACARDRPAFFRGVFCAEPPLADTFLLLEGWSKGAAFINGRNIGRYWSRGPQRTLYVPAPLLREGANELIVFELHGAERHEAALIDRAVLSDPHDQTS